MCGEENTSRPANPPSKKEYFLTATTPQALARGVSAQLIQKPRRVSPPQRRKKVKSFSSATCAAKKIPLGLQTCAPSAFGGRRVRCSRPQTLSSKKYYFFDKDNPAGRSLRGCLRVAEACGVASAWPRFIAPEAGLAPSGSPAAPAHNLAAADSLQNSDNPAGRSLRGCLSMTPQTRRSIFLNRDAGELRLRQITPTALPSSRQTAS